MAKGLREELRGERATRLNHHRQLRPSRRLGQPVHPERAHRRFSCTGPTICIKPNNTEHSLLLGSYSMIATRNSALTSWLFFL